MVGRGLSGEVRQTPVLWDTGLPHGQYEWSLLGGLSSMSEDHMGRLDREATGENKWGPWR